MKVGGIVLCGGKSSRMGRAKAWLPLGTEFLLQRVVRAVREATDSVVVVAAPGQDVPPLPDGVALVRDEIEGQGPLGGLAAGLAALAGTCDAVYLSACDVPFLTAAFVRCVVTALGEPLPPTPSPQKGGGERADCLFGLSERAPTPEVLSPSLLRGGVGEGLVSCLAAVPLTDRLHPLAAAYRVGILPVVNEMLATNRFRVTDLFTLVPTRLIGAEELRDADPELGSLRNLNTPDEFAAALRAPAS